MPFDSLEDLLTSEKGFALTTATALQRVVCRVAEGILVGGVDGVSGAYYGVESVGGAYYGSKAAFGGPAAYDKLCALGSKPKELVLLSGIRTGKSMLAAAIAIWASQTCSVAELAAGEIPRISIVSLTKDLAHVPYRHVVGTIMSQPLLRALMVGLPTADSVILRHPSGRPIEIKVTAGARAGGSLVARWSAGVIFDEAPRMLGQSEGVVNYDDARSAVLGRLLPGAQLVAIGSPWAPYGPIYELVQERWGKPDVDLVVIRAWAAAMNPVWWTPENMERLKASDATAYQTDVLAEFADPEEALFPVALLASCTREVAGDIPYEVGGDYVAAMDPATRGDAWTLVVATRQGELKRVVAARQWQGSKLKPLRPRDVLEEVTELLRHYRLSWCYTDQYAADALRDLAHDTGLELLIEDWTAANKVKLFHNLAAELAEKRIELPPDPLLQKDLTVVKRRVTQNGITIVLPRTADGRHADYAAALARAMARWMDDVEQQMPVQGTVAWQDWTARRMEDQEMAEYEGTQQQAWWEVQ